MKRLFLRFLFCSAILIVNSLSNQAVAYPRADIYGMRPKKGSIYSAPKSRKTLDGKKIQSAFYGASVLSKSPFNLKQSFFCNGPVVKESKKPQRANSNDSEQLQAWQYYYSEF